MSAAHTPWPVASLSFPADSSEQQRAVILATGAMNPIQTGHVSMLLSAAETLSLQGYVVAGSFLSPSGDKYVRGKMAGGRGGIILSKEMRFEVVRRLVAEAGDPTLLVSEWEATAGEAAGGGRGWLNFPEVCRSLKEAVEGTGAKVFYVCGKDHADRCGLWRGVGVEGVGVVVVQRAAGKISKKGNGDVFVAEAAAWVRPEAGYSSTRVWEAIRAKSHKAASRMLSPSVADFLLRPTTEQHSEYSEDYAKLGVLAPPASTPSSPRLALLLSRQASKLPTALSELQKRGRKVSHWAWWAWPTEKEGMSEPQPGTAVTRSTAGELLRLAPPVWREVLEKVCDLCEKNGDIDGVIPGIDVPRIGYFVQFWEAVPDKPTWFVEVLKKLKKCH